MISNRERNQLRRSKQKKLIEKMRVILIKDLTGEDKLWLQTLDEAIKRLATSYLRNNCAMEEKPKPLELDSARIKEENQQQPQINFILNEVVRTSKDADDLTDTSEEGRKHRKKVLRRERKRKLRKRKRARRKRKRDEDERRRILDERRRLKAEQQKESIRDYTIKFPILSQTTTLQKFVPTFDLFTSLTKNRIEKYSYSQLNRKAVKRNAISFTLTNKRYLIRCLMEMILRDLNKIHKNQIEALLILPHQCINQSRRLILRIFNQIDLGPSQLELEFPDMDRFEYNLLILNIIAIIEIRI
ncbi:MAG: hypothetical protein EZS28_019258 [Streblomastix strix]|uniref:Uncharacterized protein n=1 Tax=Streblomastix strix TaxID=222440 RepID=A0A5J4VSB3_9EUKA|nr:MAG: hypothetical protein EZS28_019258 [Streblomastix strix]